MRMSTFGFMIMSFLFCMKTAQADSFGLQRIQDDFEDGLYSNWICSSNYWSVEEDAGNHYFQVDNASGTEKALTTDDHFENIFLTLDVTRTSSSGTPSLLFHYEDEDNYLCLRFKPWRLELALVTNGVSQVIQTEYSNHVAGITYSYEVQMIGRTVAVYRKNAVGTVDEIFFETLTDSEWLPGGKIGMLSWQSTTRFDNIFLRETSVRTSACKEKWYWIDEDNDPVFSDYDWLTDVGSSVAWIGLDGNAYRIKQAIQMMHDEYLEVQSFPNQYDKDGVEDDWWCTRFLPSRKVTATNSTLMVDLLNGYPTDTNEHYFVVNTDKFPVGTTWHVWDMTDGDGGKIWKYGWSVTNGILTLTNNVNTIEVGHQYSVTFSADLYGGLDVDLVNSDARGFWEAKLTNALAQNGWDVDVYRPTRLMYGFQELKATDETPIFFDWYGYGTSVNSNDIALMTNVTGQSYFNTSWLIENGVHRSVNDVPSDDYRAWMTVQQAHALDYASNLCYRVHNDPLDDDNPNRVCFFWGDAWVGIEPHLGMLDECGFDEVVTSCNDETSARRIMSFPGAQCRRFRQWWNTDGGSISNEISVHEETFKHAMRGMLFACPDGFGYGGDLQEDIPDDSTDAIRNMIGGQYEKFELVHNYLNGMKPYTNGIVVYVVNSWGEIRSWPKNFTVNPSQQGLQALTDLPIDVRFISFEEIDGTNRIPDDADVLLCLGEPGSSWAGDSDWTSGGDNTVARTIKNFVKAGGGFVGIDAAGILTEDNSLPIGNMYGLEYDGTASDAAAQRHYTKYDPWRFQDDVRKYVISDKEVVLDSSRTILTNAPDDLGDVIYNCLMDVDTSVNPTILASDSGSGRPLVTANDFENGKAIYIAGVGTSMAYQEFLKQAIYYVAGTKGTGALELLDCATPGAFVYYYPETRLFIAYNMEADVSQIDVKASAIAEGTVGVTLTPVYNASSTLSKTVAQLEAGFTLSIGPGNFKIWRVSDQ